MESLSEKRSAEKFSNVSEFTIPVSTNWHRDPYHSSDTVPSIWRKCHHYAWYFSRGISL